MNNGFTVGKEIEPGVVSAEFQERLAVLGHVPKDTRYQHQSWLVRRWRDRYNLFVPFMTTYDYLLGLLSNAECRMSFAECWEFHWDQIDVHKQHCYYGNELNEDLSVK